MTAALPHIQKVLKLAGATGLAAVLIGLPIAVEFSDSSDAIWSAALKASPSSGIAVTSAMPISSHLALTLDSGLITLAARGSVGSDSARTVVVDEARISLDLGKPAPSSMATGPEPAAAAQPSIAGFPAGSLSLRRATFTIIGPSGAKLVIRDVNATVLATRKGSHKLAGTGLHNGQKLSFDAAWSDAAARNGTPHIPLRLSVKSAYIEATLDGLVSNAKVPAFDGSADFRIPSLRRFISWSGLGSGVGEHVRTINVAGALNWTTARMAFPRAVIGIDGNQATGALTLDHGSSRVSLDGTLAFEELDLDRYWLSRSQPERLATPASATPFLAMFDADLRVSAGRIRTPGLALGRGAATISLTNGRLQADLAGIEVEDGTAGGQLKLDVNHAVPKAALKLKIKGVDAGRLLAGSVKRNSLLGRTNVTFDGTAEGRSLMEALTTVAGRGQFDLAEPGRLGLDLAALFYAARGSTVVGWSAAGKGSTPLDSMAGRFRVLNGAFNIETLQARSGNTTIVGAGRLDVPGRLMDISIVSGPSAQGEAPVTAQDVLVMRGTWNDPSIGLMKQDKPAIKAEGPLRSF